MGEALASRRGGISGNKISLDTTECQLNVVENVDGTTDPRLFNPFNSKLKMEKIHIFLANGSPQYIVASGIPVNTDIVIYANKPLVFNVNSTSSQWGTNISATYTISINYDTTGTTSAVKVSVTRNSIMGHRLPLLVWLLSNSITFENLSLIKRFKGEEKSMKQRQKPVYMYIHTYTHTQLVLFACCGRSAGGACNG